ncbi:hypothetical protein LG943_08490 [Streptomonospora sp. S1-112]|uniref:Uncharacterized protein n=1 Tax=Streptomonospora mangrovi TaxID=2883123 RepID=A0A9X3NLM6_9ACTN|nr:hypothetical protein [Streptomonospora mangrovi]MDA0564363.1 hypothetical protein [Streptomonospora mangrovi]
MGSRRRRVIAAAVLIPAGLLVLLNVAEWGDVGLTAGGVGGLVAMAATVGLVLAALRGVDRRAGAVAVFVLAWGAVVLASALGETAVALTANELAARAETVQPWEDAEGSADAAYGAGGTGGADGLDPADGAAGAPAGESGGGLNEGADTTPPPSGYAEPTSSPGEAPFPPPSGAPADTATAGIEVGMAFVPAPQPGGSVLPYGTAAITLMLGWIPALAGTVAYHRTRPQAAGGTDSVPGHS